MGIGPVHLHHAVPSVADLARAEQFYTQVLGSGVRRAGEIVPVAA